MYDTRCPDLILDFHNNLRRQLSSSQSPLSQPGRPVTCQLSARCQFHWPYVKGVQLQLPRGQTDARKIYSKTTFNHGSATTTTPFQRGAQHLHSWEHAPAQCASPPACGLCCQQVVAHPNLQATQECERVRAWSMSDIGLPNRGSEMWHCWVQ